MIKKNLWIAVFVAALLAMMYSFATLWSKKYTHVEYISIEKYKQECAAKSFKERGYYCKNALGLDY